MYCRVQFRVSIKVFHLLAQMRIELSALLYRSPAAGEKPYPHLSFVTSHGEEHIFISQIAAAHNVVIYCPERMLLNFLALGLLDLY